MKELKDLVDVVCNNDQCVVLKVKPNVSFNLICLGYFEGHEKMFRLTKGKHVTCTVFTEDKDYSWDWGLGGYMLVSDTMKARGKLIQKCIEEDFGIKCLDY